MVIRQGELLITTLSPTQPTLLTQEGSKTPEGEVGTVHVSFRITLPEVPEPGRETANGDRTRELRVGEATIANRGQERGARGLIDRPEWIPRSISKTAKQRKQQGRRTEVTISDCTQQYHTR